MSLPLSFRIFLRILSQKFFFRNSSSSLAPVRVAVKTFTCFLSLLPSFGQSQKTKEEEEDPKRRKKSRSPARLSPPVLFPGKQERAIFLDLIALLHPSLLPREDGRGPLPLFFSCPPPLSSNLSLPPQRPPPFFAAWD